MIENLEEIIREHYKQMVDSDFHKIDEDIQVKMHSFGELRESVASMRRCQLILLAISELIEAMEADRIGRYHKLPNIDTVLEFNIEDKEQSWMQSVLNSSNEDFRRYFEMHIKDTFEAELADALLRILDLCYMGSVDIVPFINAVMRYSSLREKKHGKKY